MRKCCIFGPVFYAVSMCLVFMLMNVSGKTTSKVPFCTLEKSIIDRYGLPLRQGFVRKSVLKSDLEGWISITYTV